QHPDLSKRRKPYAYDDYQTELATKDVASPAGRDGCPRRSRPPAHMSPPNAAASNAPILLYQLTALSWPAMRSSKFSKAPSPSCWTGTGREGLLTVASVRDRATRITMRVLLVALAVLVVAQAGCRTSREDPKDTQRVEHRVNHVA